MEQLLKNNMMTKIDKIKPSWNVKFVILVMKPGQAHRKQTKKK